MTRAWVRIGGSGAAASVGLAALVLATVAISVALPRASLGQRTVALRRTMAVVPATSSAIVGSISYTTFNIEFPYRPSEAGDLTYVGDQLAAGLAKRGLPLGPAPFWSGLTTGYAVVTGAGPRAVSALPPQMEILYRDRLAGYSRLTAGRLPGRGAVSHGQVVLQVAVTGATAARFGLRPGSRLGMAPGVTLQVTGVVTPADPGSAFWGVDPIAAVPELSAQSRRGGPPSGVRPYWKGACFISPAEVPLAEKALPVGAMQVWSVVPLSVAHLSADQVTGLAGRLNSALTVGGLSSNNELTLADQMTLSSGLLPVLTGFTTQDQAIGDVLGLVFVSLAAIGIVAVVLAAALVAARRSAEFAVMRARGASLRQVALRALAASAALTLPAAVAGAGLAVLLTPGQDTAVAWWLGGCALAAGLAGLPLVATARLRAASGGRRRRAHLTAGSTAATARRIAVARRLVVEGGLAAAAVGGIIVLRQQGLSAGSVDVFSSAAPVLVAILAAIVVVHVYPVALRLLLRLARGRDGVSAFVGLSRATRTAPAAVAVVFALVLALAVVAFGAMIDDAVHRGDVAESWREVGADAVINVSTSARALTPAAAREIAAAPGAARTAVVAVSPGTLASGSVITVAVVEPAAYARVVAGTPAPAFPAASLARRGGPVPVLVSAAGALPPGGTGLTIGARKLTVRPAGPARIVPGVAAVPGAAGGLFVVVPAWALSGAAPAGAAPGESTPAPSVMLVVGPHLDDGLLAATVRRALPGASVTYRQSALAALTGAPLPTAARDAIIEGAASAAAFSALILLISLLMSAPSRDMTMARLATMGLARRQARWLVSMETLPQVVAAIAGGVASALVLGPLIAPSISLSAFTGSDNGVAFRTEPAPLVACAAGLILVAAAALAAQFLIARRRGVARSLRVGE